MGTPRRFVIDSRMVLAICLILVGVLMLLHRFGGNLGFEPWDLWPLLLVIPGLFQLLQPEETRQTASGIILLLLGGIFLLRNFWPGFDLDWSDIWPFLFLAVGLVILLNAIRGGHNVDPLDRDTINLSAFMGGGEYAYSSKTLKGGKISVIMGGYDLDLRGCVMQGDSITLDIFVLMGGMDIRVPAEWEVSMQGTPLLGGMEYKGPKTAPEKRSGTLIIRGTAIMGGVDIKA